ncbi:unnamed protein product [Didymodactylos carnosus]|uniref:RING-CH-type domain-containing protein n=2 Tax=Didymodactylos carnosus TaxID=1234261 RepID=A0A8S2FIQ1_9BILA|nr:unnamed protein product [Didymodactylos carnosus]CAF4258958.1 unnamed protein product [Didymodactylos carnosus]
MSTVNNECDQLLTSNDLKQCRICLDNDNPNDIISPCLCKGGSAYVHRKCLNDWRSENTGGKAFKMCDICHFEYVIEPIIDDSEADRKRLYKYHFLLIRDLTLIALLLQAIILVLTVLLKIGDKNHNNVKNLFPNWMNTFAIYYLSGFILFLALLGVVGLIGLCYGMRNTGGGSRSSSSSSSSSSRSRSSKNTNGGGLFVIIVAIVLIFACIGIFVGIILGVMIFKKLVKHHTNKLWLRQEAEKYVVKDFQGRRNELEKYLNTNNLSIRSPTVD